MGWLCLEELVWGDEEHAWVAPGTLLTRGPGTYKIPSVNDIPLDFRVSLLQVGVGWGWTGGSCRDCASWFWWRCRPARR
jgi:xanthine dehydrogenase molybdopterin-binding subunit B